jgi:hypothetical protein
MKKTRLLEIIREEISAVLRENEPINEDLLMEGPFIEGPLDFAYIDGKLEKRILGKAIEDAALALEKSFPNIDPESATSIITSKKSRKSENTPGPVKAALEKVDNAIQAQLDTFEDTDLLKDLVNRGEIGKNDEKALKRITSYIEPDEEGNINRYVEKIGGPQTLNAVEKILSGDTSVSLTPKTVKEPAYKEPKTEPKATTKTPAAPAEEKPTDAPAKSERKTPEEKANKSAQNNTSLNKKADKKDELLKAKKAAEDKMREIGKSMSGTEGKKREALMKDLKQANADKLEIDKEIARLF